MALGLKIKCDVCGNDIDEPKAASVPFEFRAFTGRAIVTVGVMAGDVVRPLEHVCGLCSLAAVNAVADHMRPNK